MMYRGAIVVAGACALVALVPACGSSVANEISNYPNLACYALPLQDAQHLLNRRITRSAIPTECDYGGHGVTLSVVLGKGKAGVKWARRLWTYVQTEEKRFVREQVVAVAGEQALWFEYGTSLPGGGIIAIRGDVGIEISVSCRWPDAQAIAEHALAIAMRRMKARAPAKS